MSNIFFQITVKHLPYILLSVLYAFVVVVVVLTPYVSYIWIALCIELALMLKSKARFSLMSKEVLIWSVLFAFFSFIGGCSVPVTSYMLLLIAPSIFFCRFEIIEEEAIANAILDRIVHTSHRFELKGESLRKKLLIWQI